MSQQRRTQADRRQATRADLLKATFDLVGSVGYEATSQNAICDAAGVTKGALYHHFPEGKRDLFEALLDYLLAQYSFLEGIAWSSSADVRASLVRYLEIASEPKMFKITIEEAPKVLGLAEWRAREHARFLPLLSRYTRDVVTQKMLYGALLEATIHFANEKFGEPPDHNFHTVNRITDNLVIFLEYQSRLPL